MPLLKKIAGKPDLVAGKKKSQAVAVALSKFGKKKKY